MGNIAASTTFSRLQSAATGGHEEATVKTVVQGAGVVMIVGSAIFAWAAAWL